jgi:hypothetical protein
MSAAQCVASVEQKGVDGETTNGHSRLRFMQQTLMKDVRRGLHSLVESLACLHKPVDLLDMSKHSPAQVQTFYSSTIKSSYVDINVHTVELVATLKRPF